MEQDALNATLKGGFAPLSPRFNFMGDFFLLDLERADRSDRAAFRQRAEAVAFDGWKGEARFAETYRDWFRTSPWPEWAEAPSGRAGGAPGRR